MTKLLGVVGRRTFALAFSTIAASACSKHEVTAPAAVSYSVKPLAGSAALYGVVGQHMQTPVTVVVTDAAGKPQAGVEVTFSAGGGATLDQATATTNAYGEASDFVTLGTTTGTTTISATARNSSTTVSITALPGAAVALVPIGADSVAVPTGQTAQLTVRAVDQFGNVVPGVPIEWHTDGQATVLAAPTVTGPDGTATLSVSDVATETFHVTAALAGLEDAVVSFLITEL